MKFSTPHELELGPTYFVLSVDLIGQAVSVEVDASDVKPY